MRESIIVQVKMRYEDNFHVYNFENETVSYCVHDRTETRRTSYSYFSYINTRRKIVEFSKVPIL